MDGKITAIVGETQKINLHLNYAKAGEVYVVTVSVQRPDGTIETRHMQYKFVEPLKRRKIS